MPETPSVVELCERLAQRHELIESLSAELGAARVRTAELAAVRRSEHQLIVRLCCGAATRTGTPQGGTAPVQYGPRITAIIRYLYVEQSLSTTRTAAALVGLLSTPVPEGTIAAMTTRAATGLAGLLEWVRANLAAEVVNFDETGWRVAGRLRQLLLQRTEVLAVVSECQPWLMRRAKCLHR